MDSGKVNLNITYTSRFFLYKPDMIVDILGREFNVTCDRPLTITMDKGEYNLHIRSSFRRKHYRVRMSEDKNLELGWNRLTSAITVTEYVDHVTI